MVLSLSYEEKVILADVLQTVLSDLRMEIGRTDRQDFREMLRARKRVLAKVLEALEGVEAIPLEEEAKQFA